jgi:transcription initiation factor TFIIB
LQANDAVVGWNIEVLAAACVYISVRKRNIPRTLDEIQELGRTGDRGVGDAYYHVMSELSIHPEPPKPSIFVPRIASTAEIEEQTKQIASDLIEEACDGASLSGKDPNGIAAGAIYAAIKIMDRAKEVTQGDIAEAANVCKPTVRSQYKMLLENSEKYSTES